MSREAPVAPEQEPYFTVKQVAEYLHLNEKKIYALIQEGRIPATRATGKWLFPRRLVDDWLLETAHGGALTDRLILAGADDPLLSHAVALLVGEIGAWGLLAYCPSGTCTGLAMLARRQATVAAIHWGPAEEADRRHARLIAEYPGQEQWVMVQIASREQGVMLRPGLEPRAARALLVDAALRWLGRQAGAGSWQFFESRTAQLGLSASMVRIERQAHSEREAAFLLRQGTADCAPGTRAAAGEYGLEFVPLGREDFDFVLPRSIYFRHLFQRLLDGLRGAAVQELAQRLGGYDFTHLGRLRTPATERASALVPPQIP